MEMTRVQAPMILCVDDYENIREGWRILLASVGYEVLLAADWKSALSLFQSHPVDLVILDSELPLVSTAKIAGVLKWLKSEVPILLVADENTGFHLDASFVDDRAFKSDPISFFLSKITDLLAKTRRGEVRSFEASVRSDSAQAAQEKSLEPTEHDLAA
jgi:PleD family two-component response regulator